MFLLFLFCEQNLITGHCPKYQAKGFVDGPPSPFSVQRQGNEGTLPLLVGQRSGVDHGSGRKCAGREGTHCKHYRRTEIKTDDGFQLLVTDLRIP